VTTDVVIIGAGPVGLTAALLCAQQGLRVEILERRSGPTPEPRAVSVDDEGLRIWQACGVLSLLGDDVAGGEPDQCICTYLDQKRRPFLRIHQRISELGHPHAAAIHQGRVEAKLWLAAERNSLISISRGIEAISVEQNSHAAIIRCRDGQGHELVRTTPWVIACDGARSAIREAIGISMPGRTLDRPWLIANVEDQGEPGHVVIRCSSDGAAVTMPLPHGMRRIEVELPDSKDACWLEDDNAVRRWLARGWPGAEHAPIVTKSVCRFRLAVADRWRVGRVFLAGDAAHVMPPFAGQGLGAGLRDVANLTFKLAGVHQGWLAPDALDTYEAERRPHVDRIGELVLRLGELMHPSSSTQGQLTHAALRLLSPIANLSGRWRLRGPNIQPVLTQGLLAPSRRSGRYLPQPDVIAADQRRVRLDDLLGPRMTWIVLDGRKRIAPASKPPTVHSSDRVLVEGRDFRDPSGTLRKTYGAGSRLLVRPDRIVCLHSPAPAWPWLTLRRHTCHMNLSALREVRAVAASPS